MRKHRVKAVLAGVACLTALAFGWARWRPTTSASAQGGQNAQLAGRVQGAGSPIAGSTVTLYAAGDGKPTELAQGKTGGDGTFKLDLGADKLKGSADKVLYLVA